MDKQPWLSLPRGKLLLHLFTSFFTESYTYVKFSSFPRLLKTWCVLLTTFPIYLGVNCSTWDHWMLTETYPHNWGLEHNDMSHTSSWPCPGPQHVVHWTQDILRDNQGVREDTYSYFCTQLPHLHPQCSSIVRLPFMVQSLLYMYRVWQQWTFPADKLSCLSTLISTSIHPILYIVQNNGVYTSTST